MSLKAFHIVFIGVSVALMLLLAGWSAAGYRESGNPLDLLWSAVSLAAAAGLLIYGRFFLKKLKHISYL